MDRACSRFGVGIVLLLTMVAATAALAAGEQPPPRTGWAELSGVSPGTAVVVWLDDGRRLERHMVGTTGDSLITVDLSLIASRDRRDEILALVRESPRQFLSTTYVEAGGSRVSVVQRFDRDSIVIVAKPRPLIFTLSPPLRWMLAYSGPCPNCDTAQTVPNGTTPLPSPFPRREAADPLMGKVLYRTPAALGPNSLDDVPWSRLRPLLPASLRGK